LGGLLRADPAYGIGVHSGSRGLIALRYAEFGRTLEAVAEK